MFFTSTSSKNNKYVNFNNWDIFLNDYVSSIKNEKDIIGVGYSIGGNILLKAAILYPEKLKIFLLDPTFLRQYHLYLELISFLTYRVDFSIHKKSSK